jgi:hypothetical protein
LSLVEMSEECLKKSLKWGLYQIKKVSPWVEVHARALPMVNDGTWPGFPHVPDSRIRSRKQRHLYCSNNMSVRTFKKCTVRYSRYIWCRHDIDTFSFKNPVITTTNNTIACRVSSHLCLASRLIFRLLQKQLLRM